MILAIDGNNLAHRLLHTPAGSLTLKDGTPSGVVIGILNSIKGLLEKFPEVSKVVMCWDGGRSEWRKSLYPNYKAQRDYGKEDPEKAEKYQGLWNQMEESHKMLCLVGVHSLKITNEEADDLIARIAKASKEHVMIVSSDKDMLQLGSDNVSVYSPYKDLVYSPLNFFEEIGVTVDAYVGYRAMVGDTSDNIIGIQGIGDKTAKKLMDEFGHIDNVLNAQGEDKKKLMKSKIKQRLFTPEGLNILAVNNKIMSFNHLPHDPRLEYAILDVLEGNNDPEVNSKEFKNWLMKWQSVSILSNYMPFITTFLGLGTEE